MFKNLMDKLDSKTNIIRPLFKGVCILLAVCIGVTAIYFFEESQRSQNSYENASIVGYKKVDADADGYRDVLKYRKAMDLTDDHKYKVTLYGLSFDIPHCYGTTDNDLERIHDEQLRNILQDQKDKMDNFYKQIFFENYLKCHTKNGDDVYILLPDNEFYQYVVNSPDGNKIEAYGIIKHSFVLEDAHHSMTSPKVYTSIYGIPVLYPKKITINGHKVEYKIDTFYPKYNNGMLKVINAVGVLSPAQSSEPYRKPDTIPALH